MSRNFTSKLFSLLIVFFMGASLLQAKPVARGKGAAKPKGVGVVSAREKKILGWTSDFPTSYAIGDNADFFVRGTVTQFAEIPGDPDKKWEIHILPIEVVNNPMHYITMSHFANGLTLKIPVSKTELKTLKVGGVVEFSRVSKDVPSEATGHAKLVSTQINQDLKPYDKSPAAYLTQAGLEPEQYLNATKGVNLYQGDLGSSPELKTAVATFSKSKNLSLAQEAKSLQTKLTGSK